jgi:hypothetical protein
MALLTGGDEIESKGKSYENHESAACLAKMQLK